MLRYSPLGVLLSLIVWYFGTQGMVKQFAPTAIQPSNPVEQTDDVN